MEIVVALIAALSAVVVAVIAKGTRNEARVGREENAAQHATVASVLSAHTQTLSTHTQAIAEVRDDVHGVREHIGRIADVVERDKNAV